MATTGHYADDLSNGFTHKRTKSSVLKSFIHKRNPSNGAGLSPAKSNEGCIVIERETTYSVPLLPADHPHSRPLEELSGNGQTTSPKKSRDFKRPGMGEENGNGKALHRKALSTYSLKSLAKKDDDKPPKSKDKSKPKKTKSATNLASLLSRPKSSRSQKNFDESKKVKDKENTTPPGHHLHLDLSDLTTPIYAQFASQQLTNSPTGGKFFEHEIDLYNPEQYTPQKQRNFFDGPGTEPTLSQSPTKQSRRPLSAYLQASTSIQDIRQKFASARNSSDESSRPSFDKRPSAESNPYSERRFAPTSAPAPPPPAKDNVTTKRGSRVMAAVAKFSSKEKESSVAKDSKPDKDFSSLTGRALDDELEAMLKSMNIAADQQKAMRELDVTVKRQLIRQHHVKLAEAQLIRPNSKGSSLDNVSCVPDSSLPDETEGKTKRPLSKTFTLSRGTKDKEKTKEKEAQSQSKKHRPEGTLGRHMRTKSNDSVISTKSIASSTSSVASTLIAKAKGQQLPEEFVAYLKKVQKPEQVEVGKLHKLRLLLRNETVVWTDTFVSLGGMKEIVGLLHRIMEVEWREEHEDLLLHETLLCLKALCTTAMALEYLDEIHPTLFPAIIHMLFDPEKKGPSEFTTRNIITSLLFIYLKSAPTDQRAERARILLSYLRDPQPKEEERPLPFVLDMRRDRPYKVWCTEVVNVSKEVFWIFLHNLNVISVTPSGSSSSSSLSSMSSFSDAVSYEYMSTHFPQERAPVPAAPYVGGVEWDATNYLASHLDILNGILASLPTSAERNGLRSALRMSGWEKCMGGTLRTCKEKFYGSVHTALRCWAVAALADGWDTEYVRCGTGGPQQQRPASPKKSPSKNRGDKKKDEAPPKIEMRPLGGGAMDSEWL